MPAALATPLTPTLRYVPLKATAKLYGSTSKSQVPEQSKPLQFVCDLILNTFWGIMHGSSLLGTCHPLLPGVATLFSHECTAQLRILAFPPPRPQVPCHLLQLQICLHQPAKSRVYTHSSCRSTSCSRSASSNPPRYKTPACLPFLQHRTASNRCDLLCRSLRCFRQGVFASSPQGLLTFTAPGPAISSPRRTRQRSQIRFGSRSGVHCVGRPDE